MAPAYKKGNFSGKQPSQKKDNSSVTTSIAATEKKGLDRPQDKERKKDVPPPRMQFDDKNRVEKAKRHAVVKQTEARNRVELFRHLPQYEHGTQLPDLTSKFFQLDSMHPAIYKVPTRNVSQSHGKSAFMSVQMYQLMIIGKLLDFGKKELLQFAF